MATAKRSANSFRLSNMGNDALDHDAALSKVSGSDWSYAAQLVQRVCDLAGDAHLLDGLRDDLEGRGIIRAIEAHDTPRLFEWFVEMASYQGIADQVARGYMAQHGKAQWGVLGRALARKPRCAKLDRYWTFAGCGYRKGAHTCSNLTALPRCVIPALPLRNGSLSQLACSLFLFMRDIAGGDFVGWLTLALETPENRTDADADAIADARKAVIAPLCSVHGLSDKVLNMTLASLLLAATNKRWRAVGASMIAVDTLVHNFFHRSGILKRCARPHAYGVGCYAEGGCADVLRTLAQDIDATSYNASYPRSFPRFVQHAIWRFCARDGLNVCNGNRIDDRMSCQNDLCRLYRLCDREALKASVK